MRRRTVSLVAVVGALALGAGVWAVFVRDGGRSVEDTVEAFFEARRDGDCDRLLEVVSEASWSEDGRLSDAEFREHCADVVESYQPKLHEADVRSETDDHAVVRVGMLADTDFQPADPQDVEPRAEGIVVRESGDLTEIESETLAYEEGRLVRDDGEWKVELDQHAFGLGRSIKETVFGYLDAYRDGDCEQLVDYLTEDAWSENGRLTRDEFRKRCAAAAEARPSLPPDDDSPLPMISAQPQIYVPRPIDDLAASYGADGATVTLHWQGGRVRSETASLVVEDLEWKLDIRTLDAFEYIELATKVVENPLGRKSSHRVSTPVYPDSGSDSVRPLDVYEGDDVAEHWQRTEMVRGLSTTYDSHPRRVEQQLYEFAEPAGAREYAKHFGDRIVARATEYDDVSPERVRGVDGATAVLTECSGPSFRHRSSGGDCRWANKSAAIAAQGRYVVAVEAVDFSGDEDPTARQMLGQATTVLKAQLDQL